MKRCFIKSFVAVASLAASCNVSMDDVYEKGTLVVITPSKEGLVIVADRKVQRFNSSNQLIDSHEISKIVKLNSNYGFAVIGIGGLESRRKLDNRKITYDVFKLVADYYTSRAVDVFDPELVKLMQYLLDELGKFLEQGTYSFNAGERRIAVAIFGWNPTANKFDNSQISLTIHDDGSADASSSSAKETKVSDPAFAGDYTFIEDVRTGKAYKEFQQMDDVKSHLINVKELYSLDEVISFSKFLVEESSKRIPSIGNAVDAALIDSNGFHWLEKH